MLRRHDIKERRMIWAINRAKENSLNNKLSETQHSALAILAKYRHDFHCSEECIYYGNYDKINKFKNFFVDLMPIMLRSAGLPELNLEAFFETANDNICYWEASIDTGELINKKIEDYLLRIDWDYGTNYAPYGYTRMRECC